MSASANPLPPLAEAGADAFRAFVPGEPHRIAATGRGRLDGLAFAVKDLIDVEGAPTGAGNPHWLASHAPAARSASVVSRLLACGARLVGKTVTDELAFSLEGANAHYGTPANPKAPGRLPGGSSSGSAVAVAAGLADFALGTDTGGSVRIPASFCGVYGFRPTHGRISFDGIVPFAPSYDTVGWFAGAPSVLAEVGRVLLEEVAYPPPARLLIAADAFALCNAPMRDALLDAAGRCGAAGSVDVFGGEPEAYLEAYRVLQGREIWTGLGAWIESASPVFGEAIAKRFADASMVAEAEVRHWCPVRERIRTDLDRLLAPDVGLIVPTAPCPPLPLNASGAALEDFYRRALTLTSVAGHAGLPQLSVPMKDANGLPIGLSVVAARGRDASLLSFAGVMA